MSDTEKKKPTEGIVEHALPWVEKYRPKCLEDLVAHSSIISTIEKYIDERRLPHMLFYGPPGAGKTSTILAVARKLYAPSELSSMVLELNASDDRGIDVVRGQILSFASTKTMFKSTFKLIVLDEADAMTKDAQNALRRIIEKFTENTRFCLICNYLSKIIPAIQSRCTRFRFAPLGPEQMRPRLEFVAKQEGVHMEESGYGAIELLSEGDMRRALNILQSTHMAFGAVSEQNVYVCVGQPLPREIEQCAQWLLNESVAGAFEHVQQLRLQKGLAVADMVTQLHRFAQRLDVAPRLRMFLIEQLADIEERLAAGATERLQLGALVCTFQILKAFILKNDARH